MRLSHKLRIFFLLLSLYYPKLHADEQHDFPEGLLSYYDCVCYGESSAPRLSCHSLLDPPPEENESAGQLNPLIPTNQVLQAKNLLEVSAAGTKNRFQRECLVSALVTLKSTLGFMMREIQSNKVDSASLIQSLSRLGKTTFQWAQEHCLPDIGDTDKINYPLANPDMCRPF